MRKVVGGVLPALVCMLLCTLALASPWQCRAESIVVAYSDSAPWRMTLVNGRKVGIDVEFFEELASRLGCSVVYERLPFERGLSYMAKGRVDVMVGLLRRPDRERYMYFVDPPYKDKTTKAFYVRQGHSHTISSQADLAGKKIGVINGACYHPDFDTDTRIIKEGVLSFEQNIRKLLRGRLDAVIMTESAGDWMLRSLSSARDVTKSQFKYEDGQNVYIAISRQSPFFARRHEVSTVLGQMVKQRVHAQIYAKYMAAPQGATCEANR